MRHGICRMAAGLVLGICLPLLGIVPTVRADLITDNDIIDVGGIWVGSGNGTLDLILLTESMGGSRNISLGSDGDDANTDMPTGNNSPTAVESYITSIGELREFYILNFPDNEGGSTVTDIALFLDINQVQSPTNGHDLSLDNLTVLIDYDLTFGDARDDPAGNDIGSAPQNSTGLVFSGGTVVASLDNSPKILPSVRQGAGFADYAIILGIDPFDSAFLDNTPILFHWRSTSHDGGGETIFASSEISAHDLLLLPEPATLALVGTGVLIFMGIAARRRMR